MKPSRRGFTLVELILAMAITSLLVILLGSVVSAALSAWQQGRNRLDTFANARFILSRISDEIAGAKAQQGRIQFLENVSSYSPTPIAEKSENIFFVAPYPNDAAGDLCVIAYRHDPTAFHLDRAFKNSQDAFAPTTFRYLAVSYPFASTDWRTIAEGVLEFEIQSYSPADLNVSPSPTATPAWNSETSGGITPRHIIVRLKMVDDRTAVTLGTLASGPAYDRLVAQKAREFTADIALPSP